MATQTLTVSNTAELNQALANATGGETILLAAGNYGKLNLYNAQYASNVTIKSADANAKASFSEAYLNQASNITFDTIKFDYGYSSGDYHFQSPFTVNNSSNITFKDSVFDGDVASGTGTSADGTGFGTGLNIIGSSNIDITGTEFTKWWKGVIAVNSDGISAVGNNIHTIRSDGLVFDNVDNILVEGNYIHDFGGAAGSGDHRDMIQIQRANGSGSDNITIRNNVFDMGQGDFTQTIWMGGDGQNIGDPSVIHNNVLIENNVIYNGHFHGISLYGVDGLTIRKNTVLHVDDKTLTGGIEIPVINVSEGSRNVTIENNIASQIVGDNGQSDWNVSNNALVQPGQYDQMFIYHATAQANGYNQYGVKAGSQVDTLNAGSDLVDNYPFSYDAWVGSASTTGAGGTGSTGTGGTGSTGTGGTDTTGTGGTDTTGTGGTDTTGTGGTDTTGTGGTDTTGTGGTGSTGTGADEDEDETTSAGADTDEDDSDEVASAGGASSSDTDEDEDEKTTNAGEEEGGPEVASTGASSGTGNLAPMVFDDFVMDIVEMTNNKTAKLKGDATIVQTASGEAIHLDGYRDWVKLGRMNEFEDSEQIAVTVDFTRDEADGGSQRLAWNGGKIGLKMTGDGGLVAKVKNNDHSFRKGFKVDDLDLNDTDTHQITLMVDQAADRLQIVVDDVLVFEETDTDFDFTGGREKGWSLGSKWGRAADGEISAFAIDDDVEFIEDQVVSSDDLFA